MPTQKKRKLEKIDSNSSKTKKIIDPREQIPLKKVKIPSKIFFFPNLLNKEKVKYANNDDEAIDIIINMAPKNIKNLLGFTGNVLMREFIESLSADDQCKEAGIPYEKVKKGLLCWLCGCQILEGGTKKACEHIIPALRAVMFKGLYSNNIITNRVNTEINVDLKEQYDTIMKNNYLWAHANCNSKKSNILLLKYDKNSKKFVPDEVKCNELSNSILTLHKNDILQNRNYLFCKMLKLFAFNI
jgi:hypothetical protein